MGPVVVFVAGLVLVPQAGKFVGLEPQPISVVVFVVGLEPQPITVVVFVAGVEPQLFLLVLFAADL
jgi:hypothetical protein